MDSTTIMILSLSGIAVVAVLMMIVFISRFILICHPNEIIVLSGRQRKLADGTEVGYRIIKGGKAIRIPIIEKAARMSLETVPIELNIQNAYSKGNIPLRVDAIANIKIDSSEQILGNAVERLLDRPHKELYRIAKDTLEGNLRGVLATLTPEEANGDRLKFAQSLIEEADNDLSVLGLKLDTLKVQNIADDAGYLDSVGRRKTAEVLSLARKAEADQAAQAEQAEAAAKQKAEVAKAEADKEIQSARINADRDVQTTKAVAEADILKAQAQQHAEAREAEEIGRRRADVAKAQANQGIQTAEIEAERDVKVVDALAGQRIVEENNNLRMKTAELEKIAVVKEREADVAGEKAQAKFEQELEEERIIMQQKRLTADVIEPAKAKKEAMELEAKGNAAPIWENGQAQFKVLREMIDAYKTGDGEGEKVFMLNMLPEIVGQLVSTVGKLEIDKISIIDSGGSLGNGGGVGRIVNQFPFAVVSLAEQIENATGVDILSHFKKIGTEQPSPVTTAAAEEVSSASSETSKE